MRQFVRRKSDAKALHFVSVIFFHKLAKFVSVCRLETVAPLFPLLPIQLLHDFLLRLYCFFLQAIVATILNIEKTFSNKSIWKYFR